jgi:hypothetical protein
MKRELIPYDEWKIPHPAPDKVIVWRDWKISYRSRPKTDNAYLGQDAANLITLMRYLSIQEGYTVPYFLMIVTQWYKL